MRSRRSKPTSKPSELFRAPIITEQLIIREATRPDARALEATMDAADIAEGERTSDGARRFNSGLAEVPVWSATRAVCEKGSARIVGGVVLTATDSRDRDAQRIGWWLEPGAERHGPELVRAVYERLRAIGADLVVMHLRADDDVALGVAVDAGFTRGDAVQHTTSDGQPIEFWEFVKSG